jgi:type IV pilus assembly protein PilA
MRRRRAVFPAKKGFSATELLLVVGVLALLIAVAVIAINPARQAALANNALRRSQLAQIMDALQQYRVDHKGEAPKGISRMPIVICRTHALATSTCFDLSILSEPDLYIKELPIDPLAKSPDETGYAISSDGMPHARVTLTAPLAEGGDDISLTR